MLDVGDPFLTRALKLQHDAASWVWRASKKALDLSHFIGGRGEFRLARRLQSSLTPAFGSVVMGDTDDAGAGQYTPPPALSMMGDIEGPGAGLFFVTNPSTGGTVGDG
jgi:hypothetical protein